MMQVHQINSPGQSAKLPSLPKVDIVIGRLSTPQVIGYIKTHIPVFGGNTIAQGNGGQAEIFRPLQKQYGPDVVPEIPTLVAPGQPFQDVNGQPDSRASSVMEAAIKHIAELSKTTGKSVLLLEDGYGTGIAGLPSQPATWQMFNQLLKQYLGVEHISTGNGYKLVCVGINATPLKASTVAKSSEPDGARGLLARLFRVPVTTTAA